MLLLFFAKLNSDPADCIKDCIAIAFNSDFAEANAQTRQADSPKQLAFKPKYWNRQSSNVWITFPKAKIIPGLSNVGGLFAFSDGIGIQYPARRAQAQRNDIALFDMIPSKSMRIDTVEANARIAALHVKRRAFSRCIHQVRQHWAYYRPHAQVLTKYGSQTPQRGPEVKQAFGVSRDMTKLFNKI